MSFLSFTKACKKFGSLLTGFIGVLLFITCGQTKICNTEAELTLKGLNEDSVIFFSFESDSFFLRIPEYFTPNGDSINDSYRVESKGVALMDLKIENKCRRIFETGDTSKSWNGKFKEEDVLEGIYNVTIEVEFENDEKTIIEEIVTLLR